MADSSVLDLPIPDAPAKPPSVLDLDIPEAQPQTEQPPSAMGDDKSQAKGWLRERIGASAAMGESTPEAYSRATTQQDFSKRFPGMPFDRELQDHQQKLDDAYRQARIDQYNGVESRDPLVAAAGNDLTNRKKEIADIQDRHDAFNAVRQQMQAMRPPEQRNLPISDEEVRNHLYLHSLDVKANAERLKQDFPTPIVRDVAIGLEDAAAGVAGVGARLGGLGDDQTADLLAHAASIQNESGDVLNEQQGVNQFAGHAVRNVSGLAGQVAAGGAAGLGRAGMTATFAADAYSKSITEAKDKGLNNNQQTLYALGNAAVTAGVMHGGGKIGSDIFGAATKEAAEAAVKTLPKATAELAAKAIQTGGEMTAMTFGAQVNKALAGVDPNAMSAEQLVPSLTEAFLQGAIATLALDAGHIASGAYGKAMAWYKGRQAEQLEMGGTPVNTPATSTVRAMVAGLGEATAPPLPAKNIRIGGTVGEKYVVDSVSEDGKQVVLRDKVTGERQPPIESSRIVPNEKAKPTRLASIDDPAAIKDWAQANPQKAQELAGKDSLSRSDLDGLRPYGSKDTQAKREQLHAELQKSVNDLFPIPQAREKPHAAPTGQEQVGNALDRMSRRANAEEEMQDWADEALPALDNSGTTPKKFLDEFFSDTAPKLNPDQQRWIQSHLEKLSGIKLGDVMVQDHDGTQHTAKTLRDLAEMVYGDFHSFEGMNDESYMKPAITLIGQMGLAEKQLADASGPEHLPQPAQRRIGAKSETSEATKPKPDFFAPEPEAEAKAPRGPLTIEEKIALRKEVVKIAGSKLTAEDLRAKIPSDVPGRERLTRPQMEKLLTDPQALEAARQPAEQTVRQFSKDMPDWIKTNTDEHGKPDWGRVKDQLGGLIGKNGGETPLVMRGKKGGLLPDRMEAAVRQFGLHDRIAHEQEGVPSVPPPHLLTRDEFTDQFKDLNASPKRLGDWHRSKVEEALGAGLNVPEKVLEEHNDLKQMAAASRSSGYSSGSNAVEASKAMESNIRAKGQQPTGDPDRDRVRAAPAADKMAASPAITDASRTSMAQAIITKHEAQKAADGQYIRNTLDGASKLLDKLSLEARRDFFWRYQTGEKQADPELQKAADLVHKISAEFTQRVRGLGEGALEHFDENWMKQLWKDKDGNPVGHIVSALLGNRSLPGPGGFLKSKAFRTQMEGIRAERTPLVENGIEAQIIGLNEMSRYLAGHSIAKDFHDFGVDKFVPYYAKHGPEGWRAAPDKIFIKSGPRDLPVREAFDEGYASDMMKWLQGMGVDTQRLLRIGGHGRWGYYDADKNKITTKFSGPVSILGHEAGHMLDAKTDMTDTLLKKMRRYPGGLTAATKKLAELRLGPDSSEAFEKYVNTRSERYAVILDAYLNARDRMQTATPELFKHFEKFIKSDPQLAPLENIRPSLIMGSREERVPIPGRVELGKYYVPDAVATRLENLTSAGLKETLEKGLGGAGKPAAAAVAGGQFLNSGLNQVELLGGFHILMESTVRMATSFNTGLQRLQYGVRQGDTGKMVSGVGKMLFGAMGKDVPGSFRKGGQIQEDVRSGARSEEAQRLIEAGGRIGGNPEMRHEKLMHDALREMQDAPDIVNGLSPLMRSMWHDGLRWADESRDFVMNQSNKIKLAGINELAAEHEANRPGMTEMERWQVRQQAQTLGDRFYGQVVYDNWNVSKSFRQVGQFLMRALGWWHGTISGLTYGPAKEILTTPWRLQRGENLIGDYMGHALGVGLVGALLGAIYQKVKTGTWPETIKDHYFPKTGRTRPDGSEDRVSLPGYPKSLVGLFSHPLDSIKNAESPIMGILSAVYSNRNYFGDPIYDPKDPVPGLEKYAKEQLTPFGLQGYQREISYGENKTVAAIQGAAGITPASGEMVRSAAMTEAKSHQTPHAMTPEQQAKAGAKHDLIQGAMQEGGLPELKQHLDEKVSSGEMSQKDAKATLKKAGSQGLVNSIHGLTAEQAIHVYEIAKGEDAKEHQATPELALALQAKLTRAIEGGALNTVQPLLDKAQQAGIDTKPVRDAFVSQSLMRATEPPPKPGAKNYHDRLALHQEHVEHAKQALLKMEVNDQEAQILLRDAALKKGEKMGNAAWNSRFSALRNLTVPTTVGAGQ